MELRGKENITINEEIDNYRKERLVEEKRINKKIDEIDGSQEDWQIEAIRRKYRQEIFDLQEREFQMFAKLLKPTEVSEGELQGFEFANLVRCGVIQIIPQQHGRTKEYWSDMNSRLSFVPENEVQIEHSHNIYVITELGEMFFRACK